METLNILIEITVYSAVIFIATMLLKICFKSKMSPILHYAVWFVLVLRLLIPVTFASPVRLFVVPADPINTAVEQIPPQTYEPVATLDIPQMNESDAIGIQPQTAAAETHVPSETQLIPSAVQTPAAMPLPQIITLVLLAGTGVCLSYLIILYASLRRKLRNNAARPSKALTALFEETKAELGIKANIKLVPVRIRHAFAYVPKNNNDARRRSHSYG